MSHYAPKRKSISKATRDYVYARAGGNCYLCGQPIIDGSRFDVDHELARELGGADDVNNYQPAHPECHKIKSKEDVRLIAKGNRLIRAANPATRKSPKVKIHSRGFSKSVTKGFDGVVRKK